MTRHPAWLLQAVAGTLLFLLALSAPLSAQTVSFATHKDFTSGNAPVSVAVGDFNGDGIPMLASIPGISKVQHFVDDSRQAIPLPQKGKETVRRYTGWECGLRKSLVVEACASWITAKVPSP